MNSLLIARELPIQPRKSCSARDTAMGKPIGLAAVLIGALLTASLNSSFAAEGVAATDDGAQCASLDSEWKTAEAACSTNANLGRARVLAREAETKCKSPDASQRKMGVSKFQSALRLCHKPDVPH
jgi:cobalamin biosynthesis protein CobD/CbiB